MEYTKSFDLMLKAEDDLAEGHFIGHCAIYGNVDLQNDKIRKNAFANTIAETKGRWPILNGHRSDAIIGFSTHAEEDAKGLLVHGELTLDATAGKDMHAVMRHAAACSQKLGLSIGYRIREGGSEYDERTGIRLLKDLDVMEFSVTATPANTRARVLRVKSADWTERDFEEHLRDAGLSREAAKRFVLRGYRALNDQREADDGAEKQAGFLAELRQLQFQTQLKELIR